MRRPIDRLKEWDKLQLIHEFEKNKKTWKDGGLNMAHECLKVHDIEQLKIDLAVARSDISTVKSEISGIKNGISKVNFFLLGIMATTIGTLILLVLKMKGIG